MHLNFETSAVSHSHSYDYGYDELTLAKVVTNCCLFTIIVI